MRINGRNQGQWWETRKQQDEFLRTCDDGFSGTLPFLEMTFQLPRPSEYETVSILQMKTGESMLYPVLPSARVPQVFRSPSRTPFYPRSRRNVERPFFENSTLFLREPSNRKSTTSPEKPSAAPFFRSSEAYPQLRSVPSRRILRRSLSMFSWFFLPYFLLKKLYQKTRLLTTP